MTKDTFEEAYDWLHNHLQHSSRKNHGMSEDAAQQLIADNPKYIMEIDENAIPVDDDAWPNEQAAQSGQLKDYKSDESDDEDKDKGKGKSKGKGKGKSKGKDVRRGSRSRDRRSRTRDRRHHGHDNRDRDRRGDNRRHDDRDRDRDRDRRGDNRRDDRDQLALAPTAKAPGVPPAAAALQSARQDPRAQLTTAIKFVQAGSDPV